MFKNVYVIFILLSLFLSLCQQAFARGTWQPTSFNDFSSGSSANVDFSSNPGSLQLEKTPTDSFSDNFNRADGDAGISWSSSIGTWSIQSNTLYSPAIDQALNSVSLPSSKNAILQANVKVTNDVHRNNDNLTSNSWVGFKVRGNSTWGNGIFVYVRYSGEVEVYNQGNGNNPILGYVTKSTEFDTFRVIADENKISAFFNDEYIGTYVDPSPTSGSIALANWGGEGTYDNFTVTSKSSTYQSSGTFISSVYDAGTTADFTTISWNPTTQPVQVGSSKIKFQLATSNDNATWNYFGPDGTADTYYATATGQSISTNHNGDRYIRYKLYLDTDDTGYSPSLDDVSIYVDNGIVPVSITSIDTNRPTNTFAGISWLTDQNSDSTVRYGTSPGSYTETVTSATETTTHFLKLSNLTSNTTYYYVVESANDDNGTSQSSVNTFTTLSSAYSSYSSLSDVTMDRYNQSFPLTYEDWSYTKNRRFIIDQYTTLEHIDLAYQIGAEAYLLTDPWQMDVGNWTVNTNRFPNLLTDVKEKIEGYGMQLGLYITIPFAKEGLVPTTWYARKANGDYIYSSWWKAYALDISQEAVRDWYVEQWIEATNLYNAKFWMVDGDALINFNEEFHGTNANAYYLSLMFDQFYDQFPDVHIMTAYNPYYWNLGKYGKAGLPNPIGDIYPANKTNIEKGMWEADAYRNTDHFRRWTAYWIPREGDYGNYCGQVYEPEIWEELTNLTASQINDTAKASNFYKNYVKETKLDSIVTLNPPAGAQGTSWTAYQVSDASKGLHILTTCNNHSSSTSLNVTPQNIASGNYWIYDVINKNVVGRWSQSVLESGYTVTFSSTYKAHVYLAQKDLGKPQVIYADSTHATITSQTNDDTKVTIEANGDADVTLTAVNFTPNLPVYIYRDSILISTLNADGEGRVIYTSSLGSPHTIVASSVPIISSSNNTSSTLINGASSTNNPNIHSNWKLEVMAGPGFIGIPNFISGFGEASGAKTFISNNAHHDDVFVQINKVLPEFLTLEKIRFPWSQGLNALSEIFNFKAFSAFNGYTVEQFDHPVTIIIPYDTVKMSKVNLNNLRIAWYDETSKQWKIISENTVIDSENNTVSNVTNKFGYFIVTSSSYPTKNNKQSNAASTINKIKKVFKNINSKMEIEENNAEKSDIQQSKEKKRCVWFICW